MDDDPRAACAPSLINFNMNCQDPGRYEALTITWLSLGAAIVFWLLDLWDAFTGQATTSIVASLFESLLDVLSTCVVLYRLKAVDALEHTARNAVVEARTSVILNGTLVVLGVFLIGFSGVSLMTGDRTTVTDITLEAVLSLPASILYIVICLLQLSMSWMLRLRSLKQDAVISLLGGICALGGTISSLVSLVRCAARPARPLAAVHLPPFPACLCPCSSASNSLGRPSQQSQLTTRAWWCVCRCADARAQLHRLVAGRKGLNEGHNE